MNRIGIFVVLFILCFIPSMYCRAAVKHLSMSGLEKKMMAATAKKVQFRYGRVYSANNKWWKRAEKIPLGARNITFSRKGRATFRIVRTNGKKQVFFVKIRKKNHVFTANKALKEESACLNLLPALGGEAVLSVPGGSCQNGARVMAAPKGEEADKQWMLEPVTETRFRLKNVNSGLYMAAVKDGKNSDFRLEQRTLNGKDSAFLFEAVKASAKYVYIRNAGCRRWMYMEGDTVSCRVRGNGREWRFRLAGTTPAVSDIRAVDYTYPTNLLMGTAFTLKGTVQSRYSMASLTAMVLNAADNKPLQQKTVAPKQYRYELSGVDAAIKFGTLPMGKYFYRVTAKDVKGVVKTVIDRPFTVYVPNMPGTKVLSYDPLLIETIGHQSNGSNLEKKACASFALAYCQAVLYGTSPAPQTYWTSADNVDCVWSRGGYTTETYDSEAAVLQAAYIQLTAGRPCILHVYSQTSSQHWLALVGYKNIVPGSLGADNLTAIDPWDGNVITVSDKYKIKNTYRLGVKV